MTLLPRLARRLRSAQTWSVLGVLAPLGMVVVSGMMLFDLRRDAWDKAEQTSKNLLQVIERDIDRNVEIFDLALQAAVDNHHTLGVPHVSPELRQLVLFDRATTARDMGVMFVLDERGDIIIDAAGLPPRKGNYADRDYFQAHKARADLGLFVGRPLISRLTGERMLPFSRRMSKPDGSFGGIAFGSLKLSYFSRLFDQIGLGQEGAINLYLRDGTRIMRHPYVEADIGANIRSAATFERFVSARSGTFVGTSVRDGVERLYAFKQVGEWPLVLNVALSTREIEAAWRGKAIVISSIVLVLCGLTIALSLLFDRELRRRAAMQSEFARLSRTDALTGLPNRRRFEQVFERYRLRASADEPLAFLIVDADHFKRINDRFGHAVGDEVLQGLARCLSTSVHRPNDLVCRVGGEEFTLLLPSTDREGALRIAKKVHETVSSLTVTSASIGIGGLTVSIGIAVANNPLEAHALYRSADAALYGAKEGGRNQTRCEPMPDARPTLMTPGLRLVNAPY